MITPEPPDLWRPEALETGGGSLIPGQPAESFRSTLTEVMWGLSERERESAQWERREVTEQQETHRNCTHSTLHYYDQTLPLLVSHTHSGQQ